MRIEKFEDIIAWQKARELNAVINTFFNQNKNFSFKDQIIRASLSISNNIAEGFERNTNKELKQFFYIAKGSCGEVRSMLYTALDLKYLDENNYNKINCLVIEISKLLSGFIKTL